MLHRVVFGSIERFIGILIEHFGGAFPTWMAPVQAAVLPVNNDSHGDYAQEVIAALEKAGVRAKLDDSNEKLGYRMRNAQVRKIPFTLVIGDKEKEGELVTYRVYGDKEQISVPLDEFVALIRDSIDNKKRYL